jgi:hypothetical protein
LCRAKSRPPDWITSESLKFFRTVLVYPAAPFSVEHGLRISSLDDLPTGVREPKSWLLSVEN